MKFTGETMEIYTRFCYVYIVLTALRQLCKAGINSLRPSDTYVRR